VTCMSTKRDLLVSKETYYSVKRDLLQCQKRPTTVSKETCYSVKRDLLQKEMVEVSDMHANGFRVEGLGLRFLGTYRRRWR